MTDLFGFHALQLGLPEVDGLRGNRMPYRWIAADGPVTSVQVARSIPVDASVNASTALALQCQPEALPFEDRSLDLVVMPHTLELASDAHLALAEAARVLRPEGRVVISGLNPVSLWALRQRVGRVRQGVSRGTLPLFLPRTGEFIGYWRLRDWLRLLGFEVEQARFGCYRPPFRGERWLERTAWLEPVGERWWPVFGAAYCVQAVKRVRGMHLVGRVRQHHTQTMPAPAAVAHRHAPG